MIDIHTKNGTPFIKLSELSKVTGKKQLGQHFFKRRDNMSGYCQKFNRAYYMDISNGSKELLPNELSRIGVDGSIIQELMNNITTQLQDAVCDTITQSYTDTHTQHADVGNVHAITHDTHTQSLERTQKPTHENTDSDTILAACDTDSGLEHTQNTEEHKTDLQLPVTQDLDLTEHTNNNITRVGLVEQGNYSIIVLCSMLTVVSVFMVFLQQGFDAGSLFFSIISSLIFLAVTFTSVTVMLSENEDRIILSKVISLAFTAAETFIHYACFMKSISGDIFFGHQSAGAMALALLFSAANYSAIINLSLMKKKVLD